jgi:hypothetical protein
MNIIAVAVEPTARATSILSSRFSAPEMLSTSMAQYSSFCGSSSVISNHGAFEPTKMCSVGRMPLLGTGGWSRTRRFLRHLLEMTVAMVPQPVATGAAS